MKKFEILTDDFQEKGHFQKYGLSSDDVRDLYGLRTFTDPTLVASFDTEAEAREAFENRKRNLAESRDRGSYADFRIVLLQESEYDEDGDPDQAWDLDYYAAPIPASVVFEGGKSRQDPEKAVDYMLVNLTDGTELYAEAAAVDGDDWANFDALKADILEQAAENGIDRDRLYFIGD